MPWLFFSRIPREKLIQDLISSTFINNAALISVNIIILVGDRMAVIADRLRCPYCLEEIAYLENPKQLTCSHVCCLSCLEGHVQVLENSKQLVECPVCRWVKISRLTNQFHLCKHNTVSRCVFPIIVNVETVWHVVAQIHLEHGTLVCFYLNQWPGAEMRSSAVIKLHVVVKMQNKLNEIYHWKIQ